jgi:hypothetical protein
MLDEFGDGQSGAGLDGVGDGQSGEHDGQVGFSMASRLRLNIPRLDTAHRMK